MKICSKCHIEKEATREFFYADNRRPNGIRNECKVCNKNRVRKYRYEKGPEHSTWNAMISRCENKNNERYKDYGSRGIRVCDRWLNSFDDFLKDLGKKPSSAHSIDRIDNNKGYYKENCRWATSYEQAHNRRISSDNKTGVEGVTWRNDRNKWKATIERYGKKNHLGDFITFEEAVEARRQGELKYSNRGELNG